MRRTPSGRDRDTLYLSAIDRPDGVRNAAPTGWVAGMKPIRLTEFGCAAVDRGGNAPNLFQDP